MKDRVIAFRVHYADGETLEGNYSQDYVRAPHKDIEGIEFFYDDWREDGTPRREYVTNKTEYGFPGIEHTKPGTPTSNKLATKLKAGTEHPRSVSPANKKEETHEHPTVFMKGS